MTTATPLSIHDRIRAIAEAQHTTREGNPRLVLDLRFYEDGHAGITALDANGKQVTPDGLTVPDPTAAVAFLAEIGLYASRKAAKHW